MNQQPTTEFELDWDRFWKNLRCTSRSATTSPSIFGHSFTLSATRGISGGGTSHCVAQTIRWNPGGHRGECVSSLCALNDRATYQSCRHALTTRTGVGPRAFAQGCKSQQTHYLCRISSNHEGRLAANCLSKVAASPALAASRLS